MENFKLSKQEEATDKKLTIFIKKNGKNTFKLKIDQFKISFL